MYTKEFRLINLLYQNQSYILCSQMMVKNLIQQKGIKTETELNEFMS